MTVLARNLHNKFLYGPSSLYYLGKVRFSVPVHCPGAFSVLVPFSVRRSVGAGISSLSAGVRV